MKFTNLINYKNDSYYFLNQRITEDTAEKINRLTKNSLDIITARKYIEKMQQLLEQDPFVDDMLLHKRAELKDLHETMKDKEVVDRIYSHSVIRFFYDEHEDLTGYRIELEDDRYIYVPHKVEITSDTRFLNLGYLAFNNGVIIEKIHLAPEVRDNIMSVLTIDHAMPTHEMLQESLESLI